MKLLDIELNNYFNLSLEALHLSDFEGALELIELAITHAIKKEFYMFQKIKILFIACLYPKCCYYIEENLIYFYKFGSLNIFSQILYYYQQSCEGSTASLEQLLTQNKIPSILAHEYIAIFNNEDVNYLEKATKAMDQNNYSTCLNYCDLLLKQNISSLSIYLMKAKSHQMLMEHDLAIKTYKKALTLEPNIASAYHNLAIMMIPRFQYAKAISYSQQALRIEPNNVVYRSLLAEGFYKWKKYDSALISFKKVIIQDPNCTDAYLRIADIYNATKNPKKAKRYYKKVLQLQLPNHC